MFFKCDFSDVFLTVKLEFMGSEEVSATLITSHDSSLLALIFITWLTWWLATCSTVNLFFFLPFHPVFFWKEVNRWRVAFCSISLRQSSCTHYMEFFCPEDVSTPHFYRWWIVILWVTIQHHFIYFVTEIIPVQPLGALLGDSYIPLAYTLHCVFIICFMRTCLLLSDNTNAPGSS